MKTGDIVEIKNAFFKCDNGFYFIAHSPGDPSWCGQDYSLRKICKNGKLSTRSNNIAFWPLAAFTSNREKNRQCREGNIENATIEVIYSIDNNKVIEYFKEEAETAKNQYERHIDYHGECESTNIQKKIYEFYKSLVISK